MSLIKIKNIIKIYKTGTEDFYALNNISFEVNQGEFVAIMGTSGSGKSTCMNILGTLDRPTSGKYFLDENDVFKLNGDELSDIRNRKIGFVFQGFNLISRTSALDNVCLPMLYKGVSKEERYEKGRNALKIVGLENKENNMPSEMSGGQQQRVAIARAIVNDAPLILADEPTGNLDTKTSIDIMEFFVNLNENYGKTIVLVTHEPDIAEYTKRIIKFKDGKIVSDLPKDEWQAKRTRET